MKDKKAGARRAAPEGRTPAGAGEGLAAGGASLSRLSERVFGDIYDGSPEAVKLYDAEGRLLYINPACCALFGVAPRDAVRGLNLFADSRIPKEEAAALKRGESIRYETEFNFERMKKGGPCRTSRAGKMDVEVSVTPARTGRIAYLMHVRDITELRLGREIAAARARLLRSLPARSLREVAEDVVNEAERLTGSRIGLCHFMGNAEPERLRKLLSVWSTATKAVSCRVEPGSSHDEKRAGVWDECLRRKMPLIYNDYHSLPGRKLQPRGHAEVKRLLAVPVMLGGRAAAVLAVGNKPEPYAERDVLAVSQLLELGGQILENKMAEGEYLASEERFRAIFTGGAEAVLVADVEAGRIFMANPACQALLGYAESEILGLSVYDLHPREEHPLIDRKLSAFRRGEGLKPSEYRFRRKDGGVVLAEVFPCRIKFGGKDYSMLSIRDVTKRREAEEALLSASEELRNRGVELERKNIALKEVLSIVESDKRRMADETAAGLRDILGPFLNRLKTKKEFGKYAASVERRLTEFFSKSHPSPGAGPAGRFTAKETEISEMVKGGMSSKEIAFILGVSRQTVDVHRRNIREKLGLKGKGRGLAAFLQGGPAQK